MTEEHGVRVSPVVATIAVLSLVLAGAGGMYFMMRGGGSADGARASAPGAAATPPQPTVPAVERETSTLPDVVVPLTKEAAERAGIERTQVTSQAAADSLRLPGVVEPNAYRQVSVTPVVGGRVVGVSARLGDRVRKGQSLAQVYSPEVAEARTKYVSAKAMLEAHDKELQRTEKLVEIGAASRQELEKIHAEHAAQTAEVESARSRLQLLGADADGSAARSQESATANVPAPMDGVVTERLANVGLNVDPTTKLLTVVDLSTVWIVAEVYERDLQRVREGTPATVTTTAYPDRRFEGRVSFIDPQLNTAARTAKIRVEIANPRGDLRLGMFTEVTIASPGTAAVLSVPKEAIQSVGDRQLVYVASADDPTKFLEREVRIGRVLADRVEVLAGVSPGESVVSKGSFFLRAEAERLGLRSAQSSAPASSALAGQAGSASIQSAKILVTEKGFEPEKVSLKAGSPARLTFLRTTDKTCAKEVVFPSLNIRRDLPPNEPVAIDFTPAKTGDVAFACGMDMVKGVVVVQ